MPLVIRMLYIFFPPIREALFSISKHFFLSWYFSSSTHTCVHTHSVSANGSVKEEKMYIHTHTHTHTHMSCLVCTLPIKGHVSFLWKERVSAFCCMESSLVHAEAASTPKPSVAQCALDRASLFFHWSCFSLESTCVPWLHASL